MLDLNADLGEGLPHDAEILKFVNRANIACGGHAGDPILIRRTLEAALSEQVIIGAHPSYPDRANFGRVSMKLPTVELSSHLHYQVGGLLALARIVGTTVKYLKPHGALYHDAHEDETVARVVAVVAYLNGLWLMGMPGGQLEAAAQFLKIPYLREGFADRRYRENGTLMPRSEEGACIAGPAQVVSQVALLLASNRYDTICLHGDHQHAVANAAALREHWPKQKQRMKLPLPDAS